MRQVDVTVGVNYRVKEWVRDVMGGLPSDLDAKAQFTADIILGTFIGARLSGLPMHGIEMITKAALAVAANPDPEGAEEKTDEEGDET